jgi:hypothetical protein
MTDQTPDPIFAEVIYSYTRAQALADGVLVNVSDMAREAGFRVPVALTRVVWEDCVAWTAEDSRRQIHQDESGRLWDVLWMARLAGRSERSRVLFQVYRVPRGGRARQPRLATLEMVIGPGDNGQPVVTIMRPGED